MGYTDRMGGKKGDSYSCGRVKGENIRISREGVFSSPEHPQDMCFLEVEKGRCLKTDVTFGVNSEFCFNGGFCEMVLGIV